MPNSHNKYSTVPFPKVRQPIVDALRQAKRMNTMHALLEIDVTDSRRLVKEYRGKTGKPLAFTTFLTFCLAMAVNENKIVQAYRSGSKLIIYDDVDIAVMIEREFEGDKSPINPKVIKAANTKTIDKIQSEITTARAEDMDNRRNQRMMNLYSHTPGIFRSLLWKMWLTSPYWRNRLTGTIGISSLGMFGAGAGWAIPVSNYTLSITTGGITEKTVLNQGTLGTRQILNITASFNHDVIDGAPAARFIQRFKEMIESGYGLRD
jgi:pyruvate/2-oxoglutarate dehydrogenase complex dihydrolipoamide acyltransferase (E2) component